MIAVLGCYGREGFESDVPEDSSRGIEVVDGGVDDVEEFAEERGGDAVCTSVEEPITGLALVY